MDQSKWPIRFVIQCWSKLELGGTVLFPVYNATKIPIVDFPYLLVRMLLIGFCWTTLFLDSANSRMGFIDKTN